MSLVFTLMTSETRRQTGWGGEGVHYPQPVNHEIHHVGACLFAYVLLFRRVFPLFTPYFLRIFGSA